MTDVEQVPAHEWETWRDANDAVLLDVREPKEWTQGILPDAIKISMSDFLDHIDDVPKDKAILCICRSGERSQQVAAYLAHSGYQPMANLAGGMHALGLQR